MNKNVPIYLIREHMDGQLINQEVFLFEQKARHRMNEMSQTAQKVFSLIDETITSRCLAGVQMTIKSETSNYHSQLIRITHKNDPFVHTILEIARTASDDSGRNAKYWCVCRGIDWADSRSKRYGAPVIVYHTEHGNANAPVDCACLRWIQKHTDISSTDVESSKAV